MAITFTGPRILSSLPTTSPFNGQAKASVRWKMIYSGDPAQSGQVYMVGRSSTTSVYAKTGGAGSAANTLKCRFTVRHSDGTLLTTLMDVATGVVHDCCLVFDGVAGSQVFYLDGIAYALGTRTGVTQSGSAAWCHGNYDVLPGSGCVYTLEDVCAWDGYALSQADVIALRNGADPTTIGAGATDRYRWTLAPPAGRLIGDSVTIGDVADSYGHSALTLSNLSGTGSSVWAAPLAWTPSVGTRFAKVGSSGRTVFIGLGLTAGNTELVATSIASVPTITVNGTNLGPLASPLVTGATAYLAFLTPGGIKINPGDVVTLDAPVGWAAAAAGSAAAMAGQRVSVCTGRPAFVPTGYRPRLRMGANIDSGPSSNLAAGPYLRNLAKRLGAWQNVATSDASGKPLTLSTSPAYTGIVNSPSANGLDATEYPGPVGLFTIGWDDLDPAHPTTFDLMTPDPTISTVTERPDLANPGVGGIGQVRVFSVQRAGVSVRTYIRIRMYNASLAPKFANLVVYGPGDFRYTDGVPVVLDKGDPYRPSAALLDRLHNAGSLRCYSPLIGTSNSHIAEWDQSRQIGDFGYGDGTTKVTLTQRFIKADPYSQTTSPWIYSAYEGSKFTATLGAAITTAPPAGTVETITITDAATAPVFTGLRLFAGSEVMRVKAVTVTAVTVERGCHGTTPATHPAGAIQAGFRFAGPTLGTGQFAKGTYHILTTQDPHGLVSGQPVWPRGAGWPATIPCTNGVTMQQGVNSHTDWTGVAPPALVTGPNTILFQGGPGDQPASVIADPAGVVLDPANCYATRDYPESAMVPYGVHGRVCDAVGARSAWFSIPPAATDDFIWAAAREARDNLRPGGTAWVELGNESWHFQPAFNWHLMMSTILYPGQAGFSYYMKRSGDAFEIWRAAFDEGGRNRADEIKGYVNFQCVNPAGWKSNIVWAQNRSPAIRIDGVAIAPYIDVSTLFLDAATNAYIETIDIDQAVDHWIFGQWCRPASDTYGMRRFAADWMAIASAYTAATGYECELIGYEGALESVFTGTNWNERRRDFAYHPNLYFAMLDWFYLLEQVGFAEFNYFDLDNPVNLPGKGQFLWGAYKGYQQPHGRGDGSDGKADNRLCQAEPGKPNTKASTTSLDASNASVIGQALLDWNAAAVRGRGRGTRRVVSARGGA